MKKKILSTFTIFIIVLSCFAFASAGSVAPTEKVRVIIGFKGASDAALVNAHGGEVTSQYQYVSAIAASLPPKAIVALQKNPNVAYVEPDFEVQAIGKPVKPTPSPTPTPTQSTPWGIAKINAPAVWDNGVEGLGIKVAVLDTGIDTNHADLSVAGGAYFVRTVRSYNDDNGHGTHCAGIIAAKDNAIGVVGVAPLVSLYAVKVLDRTGSGYLSWIMSGIEWSIANDMDVISMSFGSTGTVPAYETMINTAYGEGIVLVAAAGNSGSGTDTVNYPAKYSKVIAVGATDDKDVIAYFSSTGPSLSVVAPGVAIRSTYKGNSYATMSGTSMACPHAAGTVALMLSKNNELTPLQVKEALQNTAVKIGSTPNNVYGYGE